MKYARVFGFALVLCGALAMAVGTLIAQHPTPAPEKEPMVLDWWGSHLGVLVRDLDGEVRVDEVSKDGAAQKAGLLAGDVIVEYDGERVRSSRQFARLVRETPDGRAVKVGLLRNGQRQTLEATPDARSFSEDLDFYTGGIRRDVERGVRALERLREFHFEPPTLEFRLDEGERGLPGRGRLGIRVEPLSPQLGDYFGAKNGGALVSSVAPDSAAEKAGIKAGDIITAVNGVAVRDAASLVREVSRIDSSEVTLEILRDKKELMVKATLAQAARPATPGRRVRPVVSRTA